MIKIGLTGFFITIKGVRIILMAGSQLERVHCAAKVKVNIILVLVDFVSLVVDIIVNMVVLFQLIKVGQIGKVFMIINAMALQHIEEVKEDLAFAVTHQFVLYV